MLLTLFYMVATVMQARRLSFLKTHLYAIFKGNKSRSSIMLNTKSSEHLNEDYNGHEQDENFMSSHLCLNKDIAKLGELLWYQGDVKLCTIYPQQLIDISYWLTYPYGITLFPLYTNNCCQILNESDLKMHILVEADLETYRFQASTISTKLEDYGLITAWTANKNMNFILETDVERITSFITAIMQGQYYINNGLLLTRVQSVLVTGKPCIYSDSGHFDPPLDKNIFYALSDAARTALQQNKPIKIDKLSSVSVHPQNRDLDTETDSVGTIKDNGAKTIDPTPTAFTIPVAADITKQNIESSECKIPLNFTKEVPTTISKRDETDSLSKTYLSDATERKDNILLDTHSKVSTKNIYQGKSRIVTLKATSTIPDCGLEKEEKFNKTGKPPNVVIYADSPDAINNVKIVLQKALDPDKYIIYTLSKEEARSNAWIDQVALVVICGNVDAEIGAQLVEYIIHGGKLLALCSDMLHTLLPSFKTAEVRESELVHFSYGKWKRVRMMHHIFCYHASPVRTRFSQDHEDARAPALYPPASTSVKDKRGNLHSFDVKVLGAEETWHNPSILLAILASSGGKVVFSQIHLEIDPMQYEYEEDKFNALKESNAARLEIINDLLNTHLGMEINCAVGASVTYTPAYFLGLFEMKKKMLEKLKDKMQEKDILKMSKLDIQFYSKRSDNPQPASVSFLPILTHMCPANFSTVQYFEKLATKDLGRLVIYADVLTSSMHLMEGRLEHGLAVIPRQQTQGQARGRNIWLSPIGSAMFSLQIHVPTFSNLGNRISILQHIVAVALVSAVRSIQGYEAIDLRLKWPNDIYVDKSIKIGGLIVTTQIEGPLCICNIGAGINLSNKKPTTCINDLIQQYNQRHNTELKQLHYEDYLALVFNELESLLDIVQKGDMEHFYQLYYKYWLHMNSNVTIVRPTGRSENVTILGIDDFGYLLVQGKNSIFSVHPDGNSFDLLKGLIAPK